MKYAFDTFVIDVGAREILNDGALVRIEPKVLDLLLILIELRDRVVSKDELVKDVWQGVFISDAAISSAISAARRALGDDGTKQRYIKTFHGRGFRFTGSPVAVTAVTEASRPAIRANVAEQEIRYCTSSDGTRIAFATLGQGPALVKASNWLNHLEFDWESPVWHHFLSEIAQGRRLVRYDGRGAGLSSWEVSDFGLERQVEDLANVADAAGLDRFALLALSQGCAQAIAFAARYPDKVSRLVLLGGYARGWKHRGDTDGKIIQSAAVEMVRTGWGLENPAVRQMFTALHMPDAPAESQQWFAELQRKTSSSENAAATLQAYGDVDLREILPTVKAPTLVMHARHDAAVPFALGQELAAGIPGSRFVVLDTRNHVLPATDPEWRRCVRTIAEFLRD